MSARTFAPPTTSDGTGFSLEDDRFWARATEARLRALPETLSVRELTRERKLCQLAHEEFMIELQRRALLVNGRVGDLPVEVLALVFSWLTVIDPIGEVEVDAWDGTATDVTDSSEGDHDGDNDSDSDSESAWSRATSQCSSDISLDAYTYTIGWVAVTHVCHLWREIALSNPSLWSNIPMHIASSWISAFLKRSTAVPLTIDFTGEEIDETYLSPDSISWLPRARSIVYQRRSAQSLGSILELFDAPILEHLEITDAVDAFPAAALESGHLTALKTLDVALLDRFPRRCYDTLFSHLTSLRIGTLDFLRTTHLLLFTLGRTVENVDGFLNFLGLLGNLEILELHGCLPTDTLARAENTETIFLPRLRRLALTGLAEDCAFFLQHVITPPQTSFSIHYLDIPSEGYQALALGNLAPRTQFHALSISCVVDQPKYYEPVERHRDHPLSRLRQVFVYGFYPSQSRNTPTQEPTSFPDHREFGGRDASLNADAWLMLSPQEDRPKKAWVQALPRVMFTELSLQNVHSLSLDLDSAFNVWSTHSVDKRQRVSSDDAPVWDATQWTDLLRSAQHLQHLRVFSKPSTLVRGCSAVVDLLQALSPTMNNSFLSSLRTLDLVDLDPDFGLAGAFTADISTSGVDFVATKEPNSPNASAFLRRLLQMRVRVHVNLIRRGCRDYKERWMLRNWVEKETLEGRICFKDHAFVP
ncbi:hypothetical protein PENSPDRAFT_748360, partial [Peniophora sp. CONT]